MRGHYTRRPLRTIPWEADKGYTLSKGRPPRGGTCRPCEGGLRGRPRSPLQMAPKKKNPKKLKVEAGPTLVGDNTSLDIEQLNTLNGLLESGSNGFRCTATEVHNPKHGLELLETISNMRQELFLCDLTISTKTKDFDVHKVILASCSAYFHSLLRKEPSLQRLDLKDVSPVGLATVLNYAYTGKLSLSLYTIGSTISTASFLQMTTLLAMCTDFLTQEMNVDNCLYIANLSEKYKLVHTRQVAGRFMRENLVEFSGTEQFLKLPLEQVQELLAEDDLCIPSEVTVFQIAMKWLDFNTERAKHAASLISNVRFGAITAQDLVTHIQPVPRMMLDPECHRLLVEAMNYHLLPFQQNSLQSKRTQMRGGQRVLVAVAGRTASSEKSLSREVRYRDSEGNWVNLADLPSKSFNQCVAVMDGFLYVAGGEDQNDARSQAKHAVSSVCRYDPRFNSWLHLAHMLQKRTHFSLNSYNGLLFACGGRNAEGPLASTECYIPSVNSWQIKAAMDAPRCCHAGTVIGGKILITGGYVNNTYSRTVCNYEPDTDVWRDRNGLSTPRGWHCAATLGDRAYVLGGSQQGPRGESISVMLVESYNPTTGQWSCIAPLPTGVSTAGVAVLGGGLYIVGGWNESGKRYTKCVQCYNPDLNEWTEIAELPEASVGLSCCAITLPRLHKGNSRASSLVSVAVSL
ncbi:kelch-like protein 31 isoform X1 [Pleurodeles waltl]|uniref:kelch-like protein 31 isoform X1 n=1 Tax=Pleurodeles waltl TaxID=8319 RepID=UPI003709BD60